MHAHNETEHISVAQRRRTKQNFRTFRANKRAVKVQSPRGSSSERVCRTPDKQVWRNQHSDSDNNSVMRVLLAAIKIKSTQKSNQNKKNTQTNKRERRKLILFDFIIDFKII
jgi:hypothetical protein